MYDLEDQKFTMSKQLQQAFADVQAITTKQQEALAEKAEMQVALENEKLQHMVELKTAQQTLGNEVVMLKQTLEKERQEWTEQKHTLPETYANMVEMEKQKYETWKIQMEQERAKYEQDIVIHVHTYCCRAIDLTLLRPSTFLALTYHSVVLNYGIIFYDNIIPVFLDASINNPHTW